MRVSPMDQRTFMSDFGVMVTTASMTAAPMSAPMSAPASAPHRIEVCNGLSCSARGARCVFEELVAALSGDGTGAACDGRFRIEQSRCAGRCSKGPVVLVDRDAYIEVGPEEVAALVARYRAATCTPR